MVTRLSLIVGATGKTGGAVVREMLRQGMPVRALVRREDQRAKQLKSMGAEVVIADLLDRQGMMSAMRGANQAYWCAPFDPRAYQAAEVFAEAACEMKIEHIVGLSQWLASPEHPSLATRNAFATDRLFAGLSPQVGYTILNPGFFADNYLRLIGFAAKLGVMPSLTGNSRNAPPSNEDIARVAVGVLRRPEAHAGKSYRPTGPELLSTNDMAQVLARVLRRKVRKVEMPMWLFLKAAKLQAVPPFELSGFRHYVIDHKQGAFERGAPTDHVEKVTGNRAEEFAAIALRYAALPEAQRSIWSVTRAWIEFLRTPLSPGYDLNALDENIGGMPKVPRSAMSDAAWMASHGATVINRFSLT